MTELRRGVRFLIFLILMIVLVIAFLRTPHVGRLIYPYHYREIIEANASRYGVDPLLVAAVIRVESKFNPDAVSRRGALGLMQLMPSTARWIGPQLEMDELTEDMMLDPEVNVQLGTWYLANLSKEFDDNLDLVIASYNGGRGQVARWLEEGVWSGRYEDIADIPFPETRNYVQKVRAAYDSYRALYR